MRAVQSRFIPPTGMAGCFQWMAKIKMSEADSKKDETKTQRYITDKRETSNLIEDFSQRVRNISGIYLKLRNKRAKFSKDCFIILQRGKFYIRGLPSNTEFFFNKI